MGLTLVSLTELIVHAQMEPGAADAGSSLELNDPFPSRDPPHPLT